MNSPIYYLVIIRIVMQTVLQSASLFYAVMRCNVYQVLWPWFTPPSVHCWYLLAFPWSFERTGLAAHFHIVHQDIMQAYTSRFHNRCEYFTPSSHCSVAMTTKHRTFCSHLLCFSLIFWAGLIRLLILKWTVECKTIQLIYRLEIEYLLVTITTDFI
jgi:hypothetical protein